MSAPDVALTARLRAETQPEHEQIEKQLGLPDSIRELSDYVRVLSGFYTFYQPLEQVLLTIDWDGSGIDMRARCKASLLAEDLAACDITPGAFPLCSSLPPTRDRAEAFGCLYVLEGATLGGAIIHRRLHARFGDWLDGRDNYYRCYGPDRGRMWADFKHAADHFGQDSDKAARDRAVAAAQACFRQLQAWMAQQTPDANA